MTAGATDIFDSDLTEQETAQTLAKVSIPACPEVVLSLLAEARRDDVDFLRVARLVGSDVALAATVLKTANSPFFALRRKVHSVQQAVAVLGLRNLLKIIYGVALKQSLGGGLELEGFWERSSYNAFASSCLARRWPQVSPDDAYAFGLFHEAGMAVLAQQHSGYQDVAEQGRLAPDGIVRTEFARYHTSHVIVGAMLARSWYLSENVVWAVRYHHDLSVLGEVRGHVTPEVRILVALGVLSEHVVAGFLGHQDVPESDIARATALAFLGLSPEHAEQSFESVRAELEEIRADRP